MVRTKDENHVTKSKLEKFQTKNVQLLNYKTKFKLNLLSQFLFKYESTTWGLGDHWHKVLYHTRTF